MILFLLSAVFRGNPSFPRLTQRHTGIPPGDLSNATGAGWNESVDKYAGVLVVNDSGKGKNRVRQSRLATGSDQGKRSPVRAPFFNILKPGLFCQTGDFIVPPKLGEIFLYGKNRHSRANHVRICSRTTIRWHLTMC